MPQNYQLYLRGYVGDWDFSTDMVNYVLNKHEREQVNVLIDSLGGRVDTALSISSLFANHGNVHCHFTGMCASAATIAPMGAKHITMDASALILVHKCMNLVLEWDYFNADELDAHIKELEKMKADQNTIDGCIAGLYARRCKRTKDELLALMTEGAWLTAEQALEWGFVDEITNAAEDKAPKLTAEVAAYINSAGIPMPPIQSKGKRQSLLDKFFQFLATPFTSTTEAEAEPSATASQKPSHIMNPLTTLAALLGAALQFAEDHTATITEDQATLIETALSGNAASLAERDTQIADLQAQVAERDATIASLRTVPAADTTTVVTTGATPDSERPNDNVDANVTWLLNQLI
jgi:ATP-dependent protease ClpP protease subunit